MYDVNGDGVKESVPAIEVVMLNTDPSLVTFEIDVHWALHGLGYDKQAELRRVPAQVLQAHLDAARQGLQPDRRGAITDAGGPDDYTDWKSIFTAAADVDYYHWEYDLSPDPFASSKIAFKLLDCVDVRQGPRRVRRRRRHGAGDARADARHAAPRFGAFQPGVAKDYTASTTANVISTAGDATLSCRSEHDGPGPPGQRHVLAAAGRCRRVSAARSRRSGTPAR